MTARTRSPDPPTRPLRWLTGQTLAGRALLLIQLSMWSLVEVAPAYLSGRAIANAIDHGFLAGRPMEGLGWLALLAMAVLAAGWAARRVVSCMASRSGVVSVGAEIRLSRITFRYGPHADPVVGGFDLVVPEGEHLAIVGPSGVGKSTLAALMCGTLLPGTGEVLIGGVPLSSLSRATLAQQRVVLPQEAYVFAGTVWENLTYYRPDATDGQLADAADTLGTTDLVQSFGGFRAHLDPAHMSAGERQLIALTRAYLSPTRIAVLDEATCHLDPVAEARVERAFAERGGTLVVVAHRISSATRARRILVLDGQQQRAGDHYTLLVRSSLYRELVSNWQIPLRDDESNAIRPRNKKPRSERRYA